MKRERLPVRISALALLCLLLLSLGGCVKASHNTVAYIGEEHSPYPECQSHVPFVAFLTCRDA